MPANFPATPMANIKASFSDIINLSGLPVTGPDSPKRSEFGQRIMLHLGNPGGASRCSAQEPGSRTMLLRGTL